MDKMNLFNRKGKSSKALFGDNKPKANTKLKKKTYSEDFKKKAVNLASKVGVTKAAEELGVSTSSIYSWQKTLAKSPAPIQDENGNITFELEGKTYSLNVNSKEERERVKKEVNSSTLDEYDWFKEETGKDHWVLYNTEMYEVLDKQYLHYRKNSDLNPVIPINATSCYSMFEESSKFTSLDLNNFDTRNVTDMSYMFSDCLRLTSLNLSNFDTSNVTTMYRMFDECSSLTQLDLSNFNTSKVTSVSNMFKNCSKLTQLDLSNFDTSNVTNMSSMFSGCSSLISLDLSNFDTSQVTNMRWMFSKCSKLASLDLSNFDTSKITNMEAMFYNCSGLTSLNLSNFDTSSVITMDHMLYCCSSITSLDLSKFNTSQVTHMPYMFAVCKKLTTIYVSDKWNVNSVNYSDDMFNGCRSLLNFNPEKIGIEMAKSIEEGGYLTLKKVA